MTWQYTIEWHETSSSSIDTSRKSIVMVTSKPRSQFEDQLISVRAWTSVLHENSSPFELVLAAQVLKGDSPVIGAKVMATVTLESTNNDSVVTLPPIRLHDNGYGGKQGSMKSLFKLTRFLFQEDDASNAVVRLNLVTWNKCNITLLEPKNNQSIFKILELILCAVMQLDLDMSVAVQSIQFNVKNGSFCRKIA